MPRAEKNSLWLPRYILGTVGPKVWWHRFAKVVRDTGTKVAPHLSKVTSKPVTTPAPSVTILIPAVQSSLPKSHKANKCYTTLLTQLAQSQAKPPAEASTAGQASVGARCLRVRGGERGWRPGGNRFIIGAHGWAGRRLVMTRNLNCVYWKEVHLLPLPPFYQNKSRSLKVHNFLDLYCLHWQGHGLRMSAHEQDETTRTLSHPPSCTTHCSSLYP